MKKSLLSIFSVFAASLTLVFAQDAEQTLTAGEFTFKYSAPWVEQEVTSSMRAGQLGYGEGEDAPSAVFFHFAGGGGGVQANIDRWVGQFEGSPEKSQTKEDVNGVTIHFLDATGTFMESMGGGPFSGAKKPRPDYQMLAAILESDRGPVFIKLTGPKDEVAKLKEDFVKLAKSAVE